MTPRLSMYPHSPTTPNTPKKQVHQRQRCPAPEENGNDAHHGQQAVKPSEEKVGTL
ncbi:hypothetical protein RVM26_02430 [Halomonas sp. KM072]